jgi:hypothetical protein
MADSLLQELLLWVARKPRNYDEAMEAWRSHCPRQTPWEDALLEDLIRTSDTEVFLTEKGRALIASGTGSMK